MAYPLNGGSCRSNFTNWADGYPYTDAYNSQMAHDWAYIEVPFSTGVVGSNAQWKTFESASRQAFCACETPSEINSPKPTAAPTILCLEGTMRSEAKDGSCVPCEAGKFSSTAGAEECSICVSGKFSSAGSSSCDLW